MGLFFLMACNRDQGIRRRATRFSGENAVLESVVSMTILHRKLLLNRNGIPQRNPLLTSAHRRMHSLEPSKLRWQLYRRPRPR